MARVNLEERIRSVILYLEGVKEAAEIATVLEISIRTLRRWTAAAYRAGGVDALVPRKPGPEIGTNSVPKRLEESILKLKQKHPTWGARRIKHQYDVPCDWRAVHRIIKRHGSLVRVKPKPQPSKEIPEVRCRLDVAGRLVRVPHIRRGEGRT
jgi:transposase